MRAMPFVLTIFTLFIVAFLLYEMASDAENAMMKRAEAEWEYQKVTQETLADIRELKERYDIDWTHKQ